LWSLYQFCGGSPADADAVKRAFASRAESLLKISERLTGLLSELETAKSYLSDVGFDYVCPQNFVELIPSVAGSIRDLTNRAVKRFASQRTSGRDHHLVFLVNMIEKVTGREHYKEVEDFVHATRLAYDPTCTKTQNAEALRKLVNRNRPKNKRPQRTARRPATTNKSEVRHLVPGLRKRKTSSQHNDFALIVSHSVAR
jgi:hypothetical protein